MRKRILSGLLASLLVVQTVSTPVYAMGASDVVDEVDTMVEETVVEEIQSDTYSVSENSIQTSATEIESVVASGTCTDNVFWELTGEEDNLTLSISGTGEIPDYEWEVSRPWGDYKSQIKHIVVKDGITQVGDYAFFKHENVETLIIPDSVTIIRSAICEKCTNLQSVEFGKNITQIGGGAFWDCKNLKDVILPESIVQIDAGAFENSGLEKFITPSNLSIVTYRMLVSCSSLTEVIISEGVTQVESEAFAGCEKLKKLTIPSTVTSISSDILLNVPAIEVYYQGTEQDWNESISEYVAIPLGSTLIFNDGTTKKIQGNEVTILDNGESNDVEWCIYSNGLLTITGVGDADNNSGFPWGKSLYKDEVESAKVSWTGMSNLSYLFHEFKNLKTIDLSDLDTSNVTDMSYMLYKCSKLTAIDVSGFDTSNVINMQSMFDGCKSLTSLDVSGFDTSNVTNMRSMFQQCESLQVIDVSDFDTSNVVTVRSMFKSCKSLRTIDVSEWSTSNIYSVEDMFWWCSSLSFVDLEEWEIDSCGTLNMFFECESIAYIRTPKILTNEIQVPVANFLKPYGTWMSIGGKVLDGYIDKNFCNTTIYRTDLFDVNTYEISFDIIDAVDRYTNSKETQEILDILNSSLSIEEKNQRLFDYYNYDNMLDVSERITKLNDTHDERWDYNGLMHDEMYLSWQYYNYLNNTDEGKKTRIALYASGLVFNNELKAWLDPSTYMDGELPGVKKYKSLLEDFIQRQSSSIELYTYLSEAEKFINSTAGVVSKTEKAEVLKRMKKAPDATTCKTIFNDFFACKINDGNKDIILEFDNKDKPVFMKIMKVADEVFRVSNATMECIGGIMNISCNIKTYEIYNKFLQEVYEAEELPWELRVAAYQLNQELELAYWTPIEGMLDEVRDMCLDGALEAAELDKLLDKNGLLSSINYTAFCINQFVNVGDMVVNSCHTEGYVFLAMHYKNKLEQCKQQFLADRTEANAWAFYEAYIMLWKLRLAGEEKFLQMSKLEGGKIVDGLSQLVTGGTLAELISESCGYADKDAAVEDNIKRIKGFEFKYSIQGPYLPDEYKYLQKIVVECPVSIEIFTQDGKTVCVLHDGVETEIVNEYGKFISFYRATTGDYAKIAYLYTDAPYIINVVGQDSGTVTYGIAKTEDHLTCLVEGFENVLISENDIIHIATDEGKFEVDKDGDGANDIEGELADKSRIFVQFDYQVGKQIQVKYVNENGIVTMPERPIYDGYVFRGWFTRPNGEGEEFTETTKVNRNMTVYANWIEQGFLGDILPEDMPSDDIIPDGIWSANLKDKTYTGSNFTQSLRVYDVNNLLEEKTDYTFSYKNNKNAYTYTDEDYAAFEENLEKTGQRKAFGTFDPKKAPQVTIKMKGNYAGSQTVYFKINQADITEDAFKTDNITVTYTGKKQTPAPKLTWNGKVLKYGTDFYIPEYDAAKKDNTAFKETGTYTLTITGKKNFTGEIPITLTISESKKQIAMNKVTVKGIKNLPWTGDPITQTGFTVKYNNDILTEENGDYMVQWGTNTDVGTGTVTFTGTGQDTDGDGLSYIGTKTVSFKITGTNMSKATVSGVEKSYVYTGTDIEPVATLTYKANKNAEQVTLVEGTHYTTTYEKNVDKGTATIIFTGMESGGYTGVKKHTFKITASGVGDINDGETTAEQIQIAFKDIENMQYGIYVAPYMKGGAKPEVIVTSSDKTLEEGKDYKVSYSNNKKVALSSDAKAPTVTVTGKGNYSGKKSVTFTIAAKPLTNENGITVVAKDKVENLKKNGYKQSVKVYDADGKALGKNDYDTTTVVYTLIETTDEDGNVTTVNEVLDKNSIVPAGSTIQITVQGKGIYAGGEATGTYRILENSHDISKATIQIDRQTYTGSPVLITDQSQFKEGKVFIKIGNEKKELILGEDMEVVPGSYVKNVNKGTAKVTFRGINDFGGTKTVSFQIGKRSIADFWQGIYAQMMELWH